MGSQNLACVSAVIPCYQCSKTIVRAVTSIAEQTCRPAELILIDDASQDQTVTILEALKIKYGDWIRIIQLPHNVGAASARNAGWELANQPYIAFLDADDAWHKRKIEIQYAYMSSNPNVALSGHNCSILSEKTVINLDWQVHLKLEKKITWKQLLIKNQFATPSVMIKREIPFRFADGKRHVDDHLLWLEVVGANLLAVKLYIDLAVIFKPMFGVSGLSSNMWLMEQAELSNYHYLYHQKKINLLQYIFLQCFSLIKFARRMLIVHVFRRLRLM